MITETLILAEILRAISALCFRHNLYFRDQRLVARPNREISSSQIMKYPKCPILREVERPRPAPPARTRSG
jgi:hypothetical protein